MVYKIEEFFVWLDLLDEITCPWTRSYLKLSLRKRLFESIVELSRSSLVPSLLGHILFLIQHILLDEKLEWSEVVWLSLVYSATYLLEECSEHPTHKSRLMRCTWFLILPTIVTSFVAMHAYAVHLYIRGFHK